MNTFWKRNSEKRKWKEKI